MYVLWRTGGRRVFIYLWPCKLTLIFMTERSTCILLCMSSERKLAQAVLETDAKKGRERLDVEPAGQGQGHTRESRRRKGSGWQSGGSTGQAQEEATSVRLLHSKEEHQCLIANCAKLCVAIALSLIKSELSWICSWL